jgi:hypothetical protein
MVTSVRTRPELSWDPPRYLFTTDFVDTPDGTWDVSPDGKYVYLFRQATESPRTRLRLVSNAFADGRATR